MNEHPEHTRTGINAFLDKFYKFSNVIAERCPDKYPTMSDRVAPFAIYRAKGA